MLFVHNAVVGEDAFVELTKEKKVKEDRKLTNRQKVLVVTLATVLAITLIGAVVVSAANPSDWTVCRPETHNLALCRDRAVKAVGKPEPSDGDWAAWLEGTHLSVCTREGVLGNGFSEECYRATETPTAEPTGTPTTEPTGTPTTEPTGTPTTEPTGTPTTEPTGTPTTEPTGTPTGTPTTEPTGTPTAESNNGPAEYKLNFDGSVFPSEQGMYVLYEYFPGGGIGAVLDTQFLPSGWYDTSCRETIPIGRAVNVIVVFYGIDFSTYQQRPENHWAEWISTLGVAPQRLNILNPAGEDDNYTWVQPNGGCHALEVEITTEQTTLTITTELLQHLQELRNERLSHVITN